MGNGRERVLPLFFWTVLACSWRDAGRIFGKGGMMGRAAPSLGASWGEGPSELVALRFTATVIRVTELSLKTGFESQVKADGMEFGWRPCMSTCWEGFEAFCAQFLWAGFEA